MGAGGTGRSRQAGRHGIQHKQNTSSKDEDAGGTDDEG